MTGAAPRDLFGTRTAPASGRRRVARGRRCAAVCRSALVAPELPFGEEAGLRRGPPKPPRTPVRSVHGGPGAVDPAARPWRSDPSTPKQASFHAVAAPDPVRRTQAAPPSCRDATRAQSPPSVPRRPDAPVLDPEARAPSGRVAPGAALPQSRSVETATRALAGLLGVEPVEEDALARLLSTTPAALGEGLLELELAGRLDRRPGGFVALLPE